jgi:hypothetical protein
MDPTSHHLAASHVHLHVKLAILAHHVLTVSMATISMTVFVLFALLIAKLVLMMVLHVSPVLTVLVH